MLLHVSFLPRAHPMISHCIHRTRQSWDSFTFSSCILSFFSLPVFWSRSALLPVVILLASNTCFVFVSFYIGGAMFISTAPNTLPPHRFTSFNVYTCFFSLVIISIFSGWATKKTLFIITTNAQTRAIEGNAAGIYTKMHTWAGGTNGLLSNLDGA